MFLFESLGSVPTGTPCLSLRPLQRVGFLSSHQNAFCLSCAFKNSNCILLKDVLNWRKLDNGEEYDDDDDDDDEKDGEGKGNDDKDDDDEDKDEED